MAKKVNVALVGLGFGAEFIPIYQRHPNANITAICQRNETKLNQTGFMNFVRNPPPGGMPPYRTKVMTDQELADVFAYVRTFPEPAKNVPLLTP